jgi:hypothetical protein
MACGLVAMELYRGDGGLGVVLSVHADLAMPSVAMGAVSCDTTTAVLGESRRARGS